MELKWLSLGEVADAIGERSPVASEILSGKRNDPAALERIRIFIKSQPRPEEVAA
jgi:hypothetical protein